MINKIAALITIMSFWITIPIQAIVDIPDFGTAETVIESNQLEMESTDLENNFFFTGNVKVSGNNLIATCDKMIVITLQQKKTNVDGADNNLAEFGSIDSVVAIGNVSIRQSGRVATADRAEISPNKKYVEMKGNVTILTQDGRVTGSHFVLEQGRRAVMKSDNNKTRPRVVLPGFQDMGVKEKLNEPKKNELSVGEEKLGLVEKQPAPEEKKQSVEEKQKGPVEKIGSIQKEKADLEVKKISTPKEKINVEKKQLEPTVNQEEVEKKNKNSKAKRKRR